MRRNNLQQPEDSPSPEAILFLNHLGRPYKSGCSLNKILKHYCKVAGTFFSFTKPNNSNRDKELEEGHLALLQAWLHNNCV
jgi:hypothetical protein